MRDRGIELVQVLLERRAQEQHLVGRGARVGPGTQRRQRQAGEARIAGLARLLEIASRDRRRKLRVVGSCRQALAQLAVFAAVAGARRKHLDHFVVARRRDRRRADRTGGARQKRPAAKAPVRACSDRIAAMLRVADAAAALASQSTLVGSPTSSAGGTTALVSTGSSMSAIDATSGCR